MARATLFTSEVSVALPEAVARTFARFVTLATKRSFTAFAAGSVPIEQVTRRFVRGQLRPPLETLLTLEPAGSVIVIFAPRSAAAPRFLSLATNELRRSPLFILLAVLDRLSARSGSVLETVIRLLAVASPPGPVALSVTMYVPAFAKLWVGEDSLESALLSPNDQR